MNKCILSSNFRWPYYCPIMLQSVSVPESPSTSFTTTPLMASSSLSSLNTLNNGPTTVDETSNSVGEARESVSNYDLSEFPTDDGSAGFESSITRYCLIRHLHTRWRFYNSSS